MRHDFSTDQALIPHAWIEKYNTQLSFFNYMQNKISDNLDERKINHYFKRRNIGH